MCGIFGWKFHDKVQPSDLRVLGTTLAIFNDDRGKDSWGYFTPEGDVEKGLGLMSGSLASQDYAPHQAFCGHTRFATIGKVTVANAHPFTFGTVTGAHNGGIFNATSMDKKYNRDFDVDSMHLIAHIAEGLPVEEMVGYGAVQWTDTRDPNAIYLCRMYNGELAVANIEGKGFVWSSDEDHLKAALHLTGYEGTVMSPKQGRVYRVAEGRIKKTGGRLRLCPYNPVYKSSKSMPIEDYYAGVFDDDLEVPRSAATPAAKVVEGFGNRARITPLNSDVPPPSSYNIGRTKSRRQARRWGLDYLDSGYVRDPWDDGDYRTDGEALEEGYSIINANEKE